MANDDTRRAPVRVIKREERELRAQQQPDPDPAPNEGRADRALASTVKSWVEEFRLRRQSEAASLFNLRRLGV